MSALAPGVVGLRDAFVLGAVVSVIAQLPLAGAVADLGTELERTRIAVLVAIRILGALGLHLDVEAFLHSHGLEQRFTGIQRGDVLVVAVGGGRALARCLVARFRRARIPGVLADDRSGRAPVELVTRFRRAVVLVVARLHLADALTVGALVLFRAGVAVVAVDDVDAVQAGAVADAAVVGAGVVVVADLLVTRALLGAALVVAGAGVAVVARDRVGHVDAGVAAADVRRAGVLVVAVAVDRALRLRRRTVVLRDVGRLRDLGLLRRTVVLLDILAAGVFFDHDHDRIGRMFDDTTRCTGCSRHRESRDQLKPVTHQNLRPTKGRTKKDTATLPKRSKLTRPDGVFTTLVRNCRSERPDLVGFSPRQPPLGASHTGHKIQKISYVLYEKI